MWETVALLAEGVDRNDEKTGDFTEAKESPSSRRAWIEIENQRNRRRLGRSPSSRRAWIEILLETGLPSSQPVALLAEGVDINLIL